MIHERSLVADYPWVNSVEDAWTRVNPAGMGRQAPEKLCEIFTAQAFEELRCCSATIWSHHPVQRQLVRMSQAGIEADEPCDSVIPADFCLSGRSISDQDTIFIDDLRETSHGRTFRGPESLLTERYSMVSVPVFNGPNPHQVILVINFIWRGKLPVSVKMAKTALSKMADRVAKLYESALWDYGAHATNRLQLEIGWLQQPNQDPFKFFIDFMSRWVECDGVALFVQTPDLDRLTLKSHVGRVFAFEQTDTERAIIAERAWQTNHELILDGRTILADAEIKKHPRAPSIQRALDQLDASDIPSPIPVSDHSFLYVPLHDFQGEAIAVIRCHKESKDTKRTRPFTYEDVTILEMIGRAFLPHLNVILVEQRQEHEIDLVAHELRNPVTAFRGAMEAIQIECNAQNVRFSHDYFQEIDIYLEAMRRITVDLDLARKGPHRIVLEEKRTRIESDIMAPAKRFLRNDIARKSIPRDQIIYSGFTGMEDMQVDPILLTQAVFNLMENAVKYHRGAPNEFFLQILASKAPNGDFTILFEDHGGGIDPKNIERIFRRGFRGTFADSHHIPGDGLGLWYSRLIIEKHGGTLTCTRHRGPTRFLMTLPKSRILPQKQQIALIRRR